MIRKFLEFGIDRSALNHIFMLFMIVMSVFAYQGIPKEIFPSSQLDQISITGTYVGASSDVLDKMAVRSIEEKLQALSQIDTIYTTIQNGFFSIKADIMPHNDNQMVLGDVKDIISNVRRDLPSDMDEPLAKVVIHNYPLILVAISGDASIASLLDVADEIKSELSLIGDLSDILIRGESDDEILIRLDQDKIEAYGLSKSAVYTAISSLSSIFPVGTVKQKGNHLYISTINGEKSKKRLEESMLSVNGKRFYLGDIAKVELGLGEPELLSHYNGKTNISLDIKKTKDGNAIALTKEVRKVLKKFNQKYQDKFEFEAYTDTSIWIKNRLNLVSSNILFGLILVMFALFLSLNYRIALVVGIGIPASFMITLIVANMIGYSLNMLTLMGALIALGMLVDEAIVVAENIYRHIEMGKSPREAAIDGSVEMFPAILTATLTTVFAFLPLLIMSGKMGMFMQVLPVMISILLISSLFEAFYFLPLHSKEFYSMGKLENIQKKKSWFWRFLIGSYKFILKWLLKVKFLSLIILLVGIGYATLTVAKTTKFQLFPEFDVQQVFLNGKVNINNELKDTEAYVKKIEEALLKHLDKESVESVTSIIGLKMNPDQSMDMGDNLFQIFVNLYEKAPENFFDKNINPIFSLEYDGTNMIRHKMAQQIAKEIQEDILEDMRNLTINGQKVFEEFNVYVQQTGMVGNDIEIGFSAQTEDKMRKILQRVDSRLKEIDGVKEIGNNANEGERELKLRVNEYGQSLGLSEGYITNALRGSFFKAEYGKMFNEDGLVRIKIEDENKDKKGSVDNFMLTIPTGEVVVLHQVCDFFYQKTFVKTFKEDGLNVRSIYASVDKDTILATEVMQRLQPLLNEIEKEGVTVIVKGEEKENKKLKAEMQQAALIATFLIFIALVFPKSLRLL